MAGLNTQPDSVVATDSMGCITVAGQLTWSDWFVAWRLLRCW